MLFVTNLAAVDEIFKNNAPRAYKDVMMDIYPDATEDRNGRFHAPCDGYECPITGQTFRAGEYLPNEESLDPMSAAMRSPMSGKNFPTAKDPMTGEIHTWEGTKGQCRAVWAELVNQSRQYDAEKSNWVGQVGKRHSFGKLEISFSKGFHGYYGDTFINVLKDITGNVIVCKGTKKLGNRGDKVDLTATIKQHGERDGVKQTIVNRPKWT